VRKWGIPIGLVVVYLYAFPYFGALRHANELPRVLLTQEIVDRGTFRIDARLGELGSRFDVSTTPDGHHYSNKAPGLSFLAVPAYLALEAWHGAFGGTPSLREATWAFRFTAVTLPALLFLPLFLGLARRFAPKDGGAHASLCAYALGSMALPYGLVFMSHQPSAAFAGGAFVCAVGIARHAKGWLYALAVGALSGLAVLVDYQAVLAAAAVGLYLLVRSPRRLRDASLALVATLPFAALLLYYHQSCFGSPWTTGYSFAADPAHRQGVLGIIGPNARALWQAVLAPDNGLLVLMPWLLLVPVGAIAVARDKEARERVGAEALVCGVVVVAYLLFLGSLEPEFGRGGWCVGPRYIAVALPFAAWLCAAGFSAVERIPVLRTLAWSSILVSVVIYVVAATTYPHWPTAFANPLFEVSFRALREGLAPHSVGTALGLRGVLSLLPVYVVALLVAQSLLAFRVGWRQAGAAVLLCVLVLVAYRSFPATGPPAERPWRFIVSTWEPR
jgi:hypothetical protein